MHSQGFSSMDFMKIFVEKYKKKPYGGRWTALNDFSFTTTLKSYLSEYIIYLHINNLRYYIEIHYPMYCHLYIYYLQITVI